MDSKGSSPTALSTASPSEGSSVDPLGRELSLWILGVRVMTICGVLWELESESGEPVSAPALLATLSVSILA